jgi:hypothetical protein
LQYVCGFDEGCGILKARYRGIHEAMNGFVSARIEGAALAVAGGSTCYQYGGVGRTEAVVYIYYRNVGRTGVEHS